jgi:hypothetical protein
MNPNDFETVVAFNEKDIEILGNLFAQYFVKSYSELEPVDCSLQSALFKKILETRERQIVEARAAGKLKAPEEPLDTKERPIFGGKPGEPVPTVDPDDVKAVWKIRNDPSSPTGAASATPLLLQACKPGADLHAVVYRSCFLWFMTQIAPEQLKGFTEEAVYRAVAKVPAQWMGVGIVRKSPPYDVNEFLRLCGEAE